MTIQIVKGLGEATTELAAFDNALHKAGIADFNLIYLSSIIPPGSKIVQEKFIPKEKDYGKKLFSVLIKNPTRLVGREVWAGLGWIQTKDRRGLFVEHKGSSEKEVINLINNSLKDMADDRDYKFGAIKYVVAGTKCEHHPVCAIVAAIYQIERWGSK